MNRIVGRNPELRSLPQVLKSACLVLAFCAAISIPALAQFTSLVGFDGVDGANPYAPLVQGADGNFYGATSSQYTSGYGTIYKVTPAGAVTTLYEFCPLNNCDGGAYPYAGLTLATNGNFYGATSAGGANGAGTIFEITPTGGFTTLYSFCSKANCADGSSPNGLVQAANGNFYGTTPGGGTGAYGGGTVFEITPQGKLTTLYSFCSQTNCTDGNIPFGTLLLANNGNLYGTTYDGGTAIGSGGTVFEITLQGKLTTLYSFCAKSNCTDGGFSEAGLVQAANGSFYGTTSGGGAYRGWCYPEGCGTVFEITTTGTHTMLYTFCSKPNCGDGSNPNSGLVQANDGNLYGVTAYGDSTYGHIFRITAAGKLTVLHSFSGGDGQSPEAGLVEGTNGMLYGTTELGGIDSDGTVFSFSLGLRPFITFVQATGRVGKATQILGQGFTGTTSVTFNGVEAASFTVVSDTYMTAVVPAGASTGLVVVTTPTDTLTSDKNFRVLQ